MEENIDFLIDSLKKIKDNRHQTKIQKSIILDSFKLKVEKFQNKSQSIINKLQELEKDIKEIENDNILDKIVNIKENKNKYKFKKFVNRESVLTNLFKKNDYMTIYNIFFSILILLLGNFITSCYLNEKDIYKLVNLFSFIFKGYLQVIINTLIMYFMSIVNITSLSLMASKNINKKIITIILIIQLSFVYLNFSKFIYFDNLSLACKVMVAIEKLRCTFKIISYYSEKVLLTSFKLCSQKLIQENNTLVLIEDDGMIINFSYKKFNLFNEIYNFSLFFIYPTMIYRDIYPYVGKNYNNITTHCINIILGVIFAFLLLELGLLHYFNDTNLTFLERGNILQTLVNFIIISSSILFVLFFSIGHSYLNLWAEILGFGDRKFYGAFWNASTPIKFYQRVSLNWYEFFKYYIYYKLKDQIGIFLSSFLENFLFCLGTEYVFYISMDFFFPIISILIFSSHLISKIISRFKSEKMILATWIIVSLGFGIMILFMLTGYYVKNHEDFNKYYKLPSLFYKIISENN